MDEQLRPDVRVFVDVGPRRAIATVRYSLGRIEAERYVASFLLAAEALVERSLHKPYEADGLVLPILFSYRHWLELRLKALILQGQKLDRDLLDPMWTHNLQTLWARVRGGLSRSLPALERDKVEAITAIVSQITAVDPSAQGFRYTVTRAGNPSLPDSLVRVNVQHFSAVMKQAADFLDGVAEALAADLDALQDWEDAVRDWDDVDY